MQQADIAFSSAGRTIYELALLGLPSVILAQNEREMTHFFADDKNGFVNLGLGIGVSKETILNTFIDLVSTKSKRVLMNKKMLDNNIRQGKTNVIEIINKLLSNENS